MIPEFKNDEIHKLIKAYSNSSSNAKNNIKPNDRYASFDYCYNYFQSFYNNGKVAEIDSKENLETSVLQLGFYLASWGMYRGSSALLRHSSHSLIPVVKFIATKTEPKYWTIDITNYNEKLPDLMELYKGILGKISIPIPKKDKDGNEKEQKATITLVTKIMLGIFGNTPALDSYFVKGIESVFNNNNIEVKLNELAIDISNNKYNIRNIIDSYEIPTLSFDGDHSQFIYPKAKLIDMILFERGKQ